MENRATKEKQVTQLFSFENEEGIEDVKKREERVKHFDFGENRYQAIVYPEPVHYREKGKKGWLEIDNNLEEAYDKIGRKVWRNRANVFHAQLPQTADENDLVTLIHDGRTISWSFARAMNPVKARVQNGCAISRKEMDERIAESGLASTSLNEAQLRAAGYLKTPEERRCDRSGSTSKVLYEDILPGVSARYTLCGDQLKEDIILANRDALEYAIIKLPGGYEYHVGQDQHVSVVDKETGREAFVFGAPYVYDVVGNTTIANVLLLPKADHVEMHYILDDSFLNRTVYPVVIDPVVKARASKKDTTWMVINGSDGAGTTSGDLKVGTSGYEHASLLRFNNLVSIKSSDTVTSAKLKLTVKNPAKKKYVGAYEVLSSWDTSKTWTYFFPTGQGAVAKVSDDVMDYAESSKDTLTLDMTNLYRKWYRTNVSSVSLNYGVMLKCLNEFDEYQTFCSSADSTKDNRPLFTVNYISHAGLAPWFQYESQSAGRAGAMHVDLFNGNVVYEHPDTAMNGSRMPVSITHYYNSSLSDEQQKYHCGYGWKHNGLQRVYQKKLGAKDYYVWVDGTGTEHWFRNLGDNKESLDLEGQQLRLTRYGETSTRVPRIEIVDSSHTTMTFQRRESVKHGGTWTDYWLMKVEGSMEDKSKVVYKYDMPDTKGMDNSAEMQDREGKLLSITDGAGRQTVFEYVNDLLTSITIPGANESEARTIRFDYSGSGDSIVLTGIRYPDVALESLHTVFDYEDGTNLLVAASNYDGQCVRTAYESCGGTTYVIPDDGVNEIGEAMAEGSETTYPASQQVRRAISLERYYNKSDPQMNGAKVVLTYKHMCTVVKTLDGDTENAQNDKSLTYQFNDWGNVLSVHDELGFAQFTKYDSGISNAPSDMSKLRRAVVNRLCDIQFEKTDERDVAVPAWTCTDGSVSGAHAGTHEITHKTTCLNSPSLMLSRTVQDDPSRNLYYSQSVTVERSQTNNERFYTFSVYVKGDSLGGQGAFLRIRPSAGTEVTSTHVVGSTEATLGNELPTDGWERLSVVYQAPIMAGQTFMDLNVDLVHGGTSGTVYFACPQLEEGKVANPVNLVSNGDFRATWVNTEVTNLTRNFPCDWTGSDDMKKAAAVGVFTKDTDPVQNNGYDPMPSFLKGGFLQLAGDPQNKVTSSLFSQVLEMKGTKGDVYFAGCWNSSKCVPNSKGDIRGYRVSVRFYDEKQKKWREGAGSKIHINGEWVGWQMTGGAVCATSDYSKVRVYLLYRGNPNHARFTNVFLNREEFGRSFSYDKNKNVTDTTTLAGQKARMEYDPQFNIISYVKPGRSNKNEFKYTMSYGDSTEKRKKHLLRWSKTPEGVRQKFDYDSCGNQKTAILQKKDGEKFIKTETAYDATKNYPVSKTDARGKVTTMATNPRTGTLTSVKRVTKDSAGVNKEITLAYTYDASNRITSVNTVTGKVEGQTDTRKPFQNDYTYENDRLKTVAHNTAKDATNPLLPTGKVVYSFEYDQLGAQTKVLLGEGTSAPALSTNVYSSDRTRKLLNTQFGNGGKVTNTYDEFDRLTGVSYDAETAPRYAYEYGANGEVASVTDNNLHRTHWTEYDLAQRPKRTTTRNDATGDTVYQATLKYDKLNHLVSFGERVGDGNDAAQHVTKYTYDNDDRTNVIQYDDDQHTVDFAYDSLGRVGSKTILNGSVSDIVSYRFVPGSGDKKATTPLVASISHSGVKEGSAKSTSLDFSYTYDDLGNIASETRGGVVTSYAYDDIGQLISVNDPHDKTGGLDGTIWEYEYDCGGNILCKKCYLRLSNGSKGALQKTFTYTYDSTWKDKLVTITETAGGTSTPKAIGYGSYSSGLWDIGNPATYDGWTYEWQAGRQLKSMTHKDAQNVQDKKLEFFYDANGLRIQKKVTEGSTVTTTDYTLHGKLVVHQKVTKVVNNVTTVDEMHFFYDAQSRPQMVNFNGTLYTYVHNLQGDIVAIVDSTGAKVVEYKYDAWGRHIPDVNGNSATGSLKDTLGNLNPFRYRGYVYDEEMSLYYLRSRYYNTNLCRFICEDSLLGERGGLLSHNAYTYCMNAPAARKDANGTTSIIGTPQTNQEKQDYFWNNDAKGFKDPAAITIYYRWVFGDGSKLVINNNEMFNSVFQKNPSVQDKVGDIIRQMRSEGVTHKKVNTSIQLLSAELVQGKGTDNDYDTIEALLNSCNGQGKEPGFILDVTVGAQGAAVGYEYNDRIDANFTGSDIVAKIRCKWIYGLNWCTDYDLKITGNIYY